MSKSRAQHAFSNAAILGLVAFVALAAVIFFAVRNVSPGTGQGTDRTPTTVRDEVLNFLQTKSGSTNFATPIPEALTNLTLISTAGATSNRSHTLPKLDSTAQFRGIMANAKEWPLIYGVMGQQLWIANELRESAYGNPLQMETSAILASEVASAAIRDGIDPWLPARIVEAYVWPAVPSIGKDPDSRITVSAVGNLMRFVFQKAGETNNLIRSYEMLIEHADRKVTVQRANLSLSRLYERQGEFQTALTYLKKVESTNTTHLERIADLEAKLK